MFADRSRIPRGVRAVPVAGGDPVRSRHEAFEAQGEADPDFTKTLWRDLARAIERKSDHRVATGGPAYYYLKGQVLADGKRHLATLQLFKAKTDRLIWMQNYDYRSVSADVMATDVIEALSFVPKTDTWN